MNHPAEQISDELVVLLQQQKSNQPRTPWALSTEYQNPE